jgi:NAD(P)-dependent dehydrogenase (short-subunit alcohol dehydrogenase family)
MAASPDRCTEPQMPGERILLIAGADTHIGRFIVRAFARSGHTVYACMPDICGINKEMAHNLIETALMRHLDLHILALDTPSNDGIDAVIEQVRAERGHVDVFIDCRHPRRQRTAASKGKLFNEMQALLLNNPGTWPSHMEHHGIAWRSLSADHSGNGSRILEKHYAKIKP